MLDDHLSQSLSPSSFALIELRVWAGSPLEPVAAVAAALLGGTTLAGVAAKLMFTAAETKEEASAVYPMDR